MGLCLDELNEGSRSAQVRKEVLAKGLKGILQATSIEKEFFVRRQDGLVFVDRRPLVSVKIIDEQKTRLSWNHAKRIDIGMEQEPVEEQFATLATAGGVQWS